MPRLSSVLDQYLLYHIPLIMLLIDQITAQIEVRLLEFNAIVKLLRSKKFRELSATGGDAHWTRFGVYEARQFDLLQEIDALTAQLGGKVTIWEGILTK